MKLSKKEYRYRMKIVQENHYNKDEQRILDEAASEKTQSYKDIYESQRGGAVYCFMAIIGIMRLARAFANVGESFIETAGVIARFGSAAKETCGAEDN